MRCASIGVILTLHCVLAATNMSPGTKPGTVQHFRHGIPLRSAHGPLAERENILRLHLNACQQDPTVFASLKGSAEQQQRAVGSQILKNVAN